MIRIIRKSAETIDAIFIPSSDFVGNDRCFFERNPVDQRVDLGGRWGVREQPVGNSADDFMTGRPISKRTPNEQNDCTQRDKNRFLHLGFSDRDSAASVARISS